LIFILLTLKIYTTGIYRGQEIRWLMEKKNNFTLRDCHALLAETIGKTKLPSGFGDCD